MPRVDVEAALRRCIGRCAAARDGRGRRWAAADARAALAEAGGVSAAVDEMCVQAALRLGTWLAQAGRRA